MTQNDSYQSLRELAFAGQQGQMFIDIGCFVAVFAKVELSLLIILAGLTDTRNLAHFSTLARGMDARVKVERIKRIAKMNAGIGPNLSKRLHVFEKSLCPIRNDLIHNGTAHSEDDGPLRYFNFSISNMPWEELGGPPMEHIMHGKPTEFTSRYLFECSDWMARLNLDLRQIVPQTTQKCILEIENPKSSPQLASRPAPHRKDDRAKPDKPVQT